MLWFGFYMAVSSVVYGASHRRIGRALIHHNFVKPHEALEGQIPADRAGMGVEGQNKWLTLLRNSVRGQGGASN